MLMWTLTPFQTALPSRRACSRSHPCFAILHLATSDLFRISDFDIRISTPGPLLFCYRYLSVTFRRVVKKTNVDAACYLLLPFGSRIGGWRGERPLHASTLHALWNGRYGGTPPVRPPVPHKTLINIGLARRYGPVRLKSRRPGGEKGKPSSPAFVAHFVELPSIFRPPPSVLSPTARTQT